MSEAVWIVGRGLLGSTIESLVRVDAPEAVVFNAPSFTWSDPPTVRSECAASIARFGEAAKRTGRYRVFWAAGSSVMSSTEDDLRRETENLATFVRAFATDDNLQRAAGVFGFSSSAGGVYAGSADEVVTEASDVSPGTPYGKGKLEQEALVKTLARTNRGVLLARISSLYGPGQARAKKQGLLTHIARCLLIRRPIHIYVPFDTVRDYLHVRDAATDFINASELVGGNEVVTKIVASEEPATIAMIVGLFRRITRLQPLLAMGTTAVGASYPHRVQFSSRVLTQARGTRRVGLPEGIAEIFEHERRAYAGSGMPLGGS